MDFFKVIRQCLTGAENDDAFPQQYIHHGEKKPGLTSPPASPTEEDLASTIVTLLLTAEKPGQDLKRKIQAEVHTTGWYESLAKRVLDGIIAAVEADAPMATAMREAFENAASIADEFVKEHPVLVAAMATIVAIGILVILLPYVVEALGFGELGPIRASFAALWQSTFPDVPAGSFFSWLQRLGMTWGKK